MLLTATDLLYGYYNGIFPMAEADGTIYWYAPDPRAIIPFQQYKPSKSLRPFLNNPDYEVKFNQNFEEVIKKCALPRSIEDGTWISADLIEAYTDLYHLGYVLSVETYYKEELVGGLYGVVLGKAFFGESMFYTKPNASKIAFYHLVEFLKKNGFTLLDTQFINDNVRRFGAIEIPKKDYIKLLKAATAGHISFQKSEKNIK